MIRLQPPNVFSTAIATIQNNAYVRPAPWAVPWLIILAAALLSCFLWMISKPNLLLGAIIFVAGYALLALSLLATDRVWLPMFLPLALLGFLLVVRLFSGRRTGPKSNARTRLARNPSDRARHDEEVLGGGLEPPCLAAYAPQTYVSAISPPEREPRILNQERRKARSSCTRCG